MLCVLLQPHTVERVALRQFHNHHRCSYFATSMPGSTRKSPRIKLALLAILFQRASPRHWNRLKSEQVITLKLWMQYCKSRTALKFITRANRFTRAEKSAEYRNEHEEWIRNKRYPQDIIHTRSNLFRYTQTMRKASSATSGANFDLET